MPRPPRLALLAVLLAAAALGSAAPARAAECPSETFLTYGGVVYAAELLPAGTSLPAGEALGDGTLDEPRGEDACKRKRIEIQVLGVGGVDPRVAVAVADRPGTVFVLGGRCSGLENAGRWGCLTEPLVFQGTSYTAVAYPAEPLPRGTLPLGDALGEGDLGGKPAAVVAIEGVDPALAVGIAGRPEEALVAPGVCPYERFATDEELDDLRRCLTGPVWLVFDPLGAKSGATVTAVSDRTLGPELAGASVALVRLGTAADALPDDLSGAVPVGSIEPGADGRATLAIVLPDVGQGLYEAVVTCEACAGAYGGRTAFPAGSVTVFEGQEGGGGGPRVALIVVGAVFMLLLALAVVAWRKGWHRRRAA